MPALLRAAGGIFLTYLQVSSLTAGTTGTEILHPPGTSQLFPGRHALFSHLGGFTPEDALGTTHCPVDKQTFLSCPQPHMPQSLFQIKKEIPGGYAPGLGAKCLPSSVSKQGSLNYPALETHTHSCI